MPASDTAADSKELPDPRSLGEALAYFESYLRFRRHYLRVPGVQAAVFAAGSVRLSMAAGLADLAAQVPMTTRHLFRIASHSKTFTATAVLQLAERGRLRLDDPVSRWVTELDGTAVGSVTLRDLLNHTGGVVRDGRNGDFWQLVREFPDRQELLTMAGAADGVVLGPNERFKYSNVGYSLLGLAIEAASGHSFADQIRHSIIDPLGLTDLGPEYLPERSADYATGYSALAYADVRTPISHLDTRAMAAATGFFATADQLVRYFAAHFGGDTRLLSDSSKRLLQHGWWETGEKDGRYGLGFAVVKVGERSLIGHGGGYPGHITSSVLDPDAGLAVSVLTNAIDGPAEELAHAGVTLIDLAGRKARPAAGPDLTRFTGRFASLWGVIDIVVLGGRLYRIHPASADLDHDAAELAYVDEHTLRVVGGSNFGSYGEPIGFEFGPGGEVRILRGESGMTLWPIEAFSLTGPVRVGHGPMDAS